MGEQGIGLSRRGLMQLVGEHRGASTSSGGGTGGGSVENGRHTGSGGGDSSSSCSGREEASAEGRVITAEQAAAALATYACSATGAGSSGGASGAKRVGNAGVRVPAVPDTAANGGASAGSGAVVGVEGPSAAAMEPRELLAASQHQLYLHTLLHRLYGEAMESHHVAQEALKAARTQHAQLKQLWCTRDKAGQAGEQLVIPGGEEEEAGEQLLVPGEAEPQAPAATLGEAGAQARAPTPVALRERARLMLAAAGGVYRIDTALS